MSRAGLGRLGLNLTAAGLAAAVGRAAWSAARTSRRSGRWDRLNHRGETVSLLEGPAYTVAAAAVVALVPGVPARVRTAAVLATLGGGVFGAIDDLHESGKSKGLRGHLGELAHGRVTTGGLKVLGIGGTGLLASAVLAHGRQRSVANIVDAVLSGALIAGTANLMNLFDLRPGRALKVVLLTAPALVSGGPGSTLIGAATGAAAGLLPVDLTEQAMLGDTGANAAGALLGTAAVAGLSRRGRLLALLAVTGLTLASERVSFTAVIARTPVLREFDALGRRK